MGRHSSSRRWPFYRSVVGWFLPWVLIAAVIGVAVWFAVDAVGNDDDVDVASVRETPSPSPKPSATKERDEPSPQASETPKPQATEVELITDGITVQVLNATDAPDAEEQMAQRLMELGFEVVVQEQASTRYSETTVFWSNDQSKDAAVRLAGRFGWVALPKPGNLSAEVSIHVVVGEDEV